MADDSTEQREYEVVVVGGGPAGLSATLYNTRLGHSTALVQRGGGRAAMMRDVHNVVGVTEDVTGNEFLETGREQLADYGCDLYRDFVSSASETEDGRFRVCGTDADYVAEFLVLATGFDDVTPGPPLPRTDPRAESACPDSARLGQLLVAHLPVHAKASASTWN